MQSSSSNNGGQPRAFNNPRELSSEEQQYQAQLRKLACLPLSNQINLLGQAYSEQPGILDETQFKYLFELVTRQFLADGQNKISQKDFEDMVFVLCSYLEKIDGSLYEKYYNKQKSYLPPTMDLALAYHYENLKPILQKYQTLYGKNDPENSTRIDHILNELDFNFQIATQRKPGAYVQFEGRPSQRRFNTNTSKCVAIDDAKLPTQTVNMDGEKVSESEIERNLRDIPGKYKHVKRHLGISLPVGKYIADPTVLSPDHKQLDPLKQKLAAPSRLYFGVSHQESLEDLEEIEKQIKQLETKLTQVSEPKEMDVEGTSVNVVCKFEKIENLAMQLEIDRIGEEVLQITQMIELYDKYRQNKTETRYAVLKRLQRADEQLYQMISQATQPSEKIKLQILDLEIDNLLESGKNLLLIPKKFKRNKQPESDEVFTNSEQEPLSSELNKGAVPMLTDKTMPEVKEITKAHLKVLNKFFNRVNKNLLRDLYLSEGTIVNQQRIKALYELIKGDENACMHRLHLMHPKEWDKVQSLEVDSQPVAAPKILIINPSPASDSSSSEMRPSRVIDLSESPELILENSTEIRLVDKQAHSDVSRKRKHSTTKIIEISLLEVKKEGSEGVVSALNKGQEVVEEDDRPTKKAKRERQASPVKNSPAKMETQQPLAEAPQPQQEPKKESLKLRLPKMPRLQPQPQQAYMPFQQPQPLQSYMPQQMPMQQQGQPNMTLQMPMPMQMPAAQSPYNPQQPTLAGMELDGSTLNGVQQPLQSQLGFFASQGMLSFNDPLAFSQFAPPPIGLLPPQSDDEFFNNLFR